MIVFEPEPAPPTEDEFLNWLDDRERRIQTCGATPERGHLWRVEGEAGVSPWLSCEECPADGDDLVDDSCVYLEDEPYDLGGRVVDFSTPLADDVEWFGIPVTARVEADMVRTFIVHLAPREEAA